MIQAQALACVPLSIATTTIAAPVSAFYLDSLHRVNRKGAIRKTTTRAVAYNGQVFTIHFARRKRPGEHARRSKGRG